MCVCVCLCQNDILHWVNTPTLDSCFGLVGHHQQGAECDPVESHPLNIMAYAQPLACGCKLSKITPLACAVTMTTNNHKKMCVYPCGVPPARIDVKCFILSYVQAPALPLSVAAASLLSTLACTAEAQNLRR